MKKTKLSNIKNITVSGRIGSGATTLAKDIAQKLNWKFKEGGDVFVHYKSITGEGRRDLKQGDHVEFDVENSPKGLQAINVTKL